MNKSLLLVCFFFTVAMVFAQTNPKGRPDGRSGTASEKEEKPPISLYKIMSLDRDTTYVDTTLSMEKMYRFNYLRRDDFELLPFSNVGQTYNSLAYDFDKLNMKPLFVAQSHHLNYMDVEDIYY